MKIFMHSNNLHVIAWFSMPHCINWANVYLSYAKATQIIASLIYLSISNVWFIFVFFSKKQVSFFPVLISLNSFDYRKIYTRGWVIQVVKNLHVFKYFPFRIFDILLAEAIKKQHIHNSFAWNLLGSVV